MKVCGRCGRHYEEADRFCQICGIELSAAGTAPARPAPAPPAAVAVAPIQAVAAVPLATAAPAAAPRALPNAPAAGWSTTAIASIVTLVVGLTVVSIPLGHYALSQIKVTGQRGRGLAIASLVLGYPVFLFWTIIFISAFATAARNSS